MIQPVRAEQSALFPRSPDPSLQPITLPSKSTPGKPRRAISISGAEGSKSKPQRRAGESPLAGLLRSDAPPRGAGGGKNCVGFRGLGKGCDGWTWGGSLRKTARERPEVVVAVVRVCMCWIGYRGSEAGYARLPDRLTVLLYVGWLVCIACPIMDIM